ncbi:hypothetical protein SBA2_740030 [Acidobacteriia bacterium SbA2]|nr:hypothetical protein SBA2_740030 [Acidobacteriia bacterium SbA2]
MPYPRQELQKRGDGKPPPYGGPVIDGLGTLQRACKLCQCLVALHSGPLRGLAALRQLIQGDKYAKAEGRCDQRGTIPARRSRLGGRARGQSRQTA